MPSYFPCPNPQCSYQFDADILPPAAMVTCPLCRTRFPYRASRPAPATTPADGTPASGTPAAGTAAAGPRLVQLRQAPKSAVLPTVLWVGGFSLVLGLLVVGLIMRGRGTTDNGSDAKDERFNVKVEPFPSAWEADAAAQKPVNGNILGRKRAGPDAWIAVAAQDFGKRMPRPAEMRELMEGRLRGFSSLETEPIEGVTWAGHPALAVRFTGTLEEAQVRGEAYAFAFKGIGYAYFAWAGEANWESVRAEASGLREKVTPANYRGDWKEEQLNTEVHTVEGAAYQVEDVDGKVWVRAKPEDQWTKEDKLKYPLDDPKEEDPAATMAFLAQYKIRGGGDNKRQPAEAKALVVELPGGGDPLEAAKNHVLERIKREFAATGAQVPPGLKLEPMNRSPGGVSLPSGGPAIGRFLFRDPFDPKSPVMYVISAASVGGKTVAVEAHCLDKDASYLDEWMVHLAGSLKAR